jgi:hypothetical protein
MPRGGARIGAGRPRLPLATHIARGTYRRDRHGAPPVIGNLTVLPNGASGWVPSDQDVATLKAPGKALLEALLTDFEFTKIEGQLALEAAHATDRLHAVRTVSRRGATLREVTSLERLDQNWSKILSGLLMLLKVTR